MNDKLIVFWDVRYDFKKELKRGYGCLVVKG